MVLVVEVVQVMEEVVVQCCEGPSSDRIGAAPDDGLDADTIDTVDEEMSVRVAEGRPCCCWVGTLPDKVVGVFAVFGHASVAKVLLFRGSSSL